MIPITVPVEPDAPDAREWLLDELSKPAYERAKPNWFDRASQAVWDWITSLFEGGFGGPPVLTLVLLGLLILGGVVLAFVLFGSPRLNRRSSAFGAVFGETDERDAAELRRAADAAASRGDWTLAIEELFRAIARGLAERAVLTTSPGTTAHHLAERAGAAFPAFADRLRGAARIFDEVRYLGIPGSADRFDAVLSLERELRSARPAAPSTAAVPA
ncbi:DUF4129 domain-containing protein [Lysobacter korlensis]|uniref:DUF4129 domain-containing protein n=1 Tax=Lysobacter korlensis TaxID=553636 RepID=A0ABV6RWM1_9GAMM